MAIQGYFRCSECGFFHAENFVGKCTDKKSRYTAEQLDKRHGEGRWFEIDLEDEPPPKPQKRNLDRIERITAQTDLNGNKLEVGCRVRAFHFYQYDAASDLCIGTNVLEESAGYWEGELIAIGVQSPDPHVEGERYQIVADTDVFRMSDRRAGSSRIVRQPNLVETIYPPVNGTPVLDRGVDLGWRTFGVFRITEE